MDDVAHYLRGTVGVQTTHKSVLFVGKDFAAADGTDFRHFKRNAVRGTVFFYDFDNFGYYISRFLNYYAVAYADIFFRNKIFVVQRRF